MRQILALYAICAWHTFFPIPDSPNFSDSHNAWADSVTLKWCDLSCVLIYYPDGCDFLTTCSETFVYNVMHPVYASEYKSHSYIIIIIPLDSSYLRMIGEKCPLGQYYLACVPVHYARVPPLCMDCAISSNFPSDEIHWNGDNLLLVTCLLR